MPEGRSFADHEARLGPSLDELRDSSPDLPSRSLAERYFTRSRGRVGDYELAMWAFVVNRITGVLLLAYLIFHIAALVFVPGVYDGAAPGHWVVLVVDVSAVGTVTYHGLNGLRLLLGDLGLLAGRRSRLLAIRGTAILSVIATLAAIARVVSR
jgi:succinate dehydrogenase/fumarate reductase cytochrome b subunit